MKKIRLALIAAGLCASLSAVPVQAVGVWDACNGANSSSAVCADRTGTNATGIVKQIINLFLYAIGILSVIMIIHSGLKYTTSRGDAEQIKSAKNTLLYAVIGLIVALLAFTIVNFVIGVFKDNSSTQPAAADAAGTPDN